MNKAVIGIAQTLPQAEKIVSAQDVDHPRSFGAEEPVDRGGANVTPMDQLELKQ